MFLVTDARADGDGRSEGREDAVALKDERAEPDLFPLALKETVALDERLVLALALKETVTLDERLVLALGTAEFDVFALSL